MNEKIISYISVLLGIILISIVLLFKLNGLIGCSLVIIGILLCLFSIILGKTLRSLCISHLDIVDLFLDILLDLYT